MAHFVEAQPFERSDESFRSNGGQLSFIARDNRHAAYRFRKKAERALRRLSRFPESGRLIPEFPDLPFREVVVPPYRLFYRREGESVWVVACWQGAQLPVELKEKL